MRRLSARVTRAASGEEGSVLPLALGYVGLALVAVLVCVDATSLYLSQRRLEALAAAAALAGADGFTLTIAGGEPQALLTDDAVHAQASALVGASGSPARLVEAQTPDGVSARVTIASTWRAPVLTLFVPEGVALEATATSRTALR